MLTRYVLPSGHLSILCGAHQRTLHHQSRVSGDDSSLAALSVCQCTVSVRGCAQCVGEVLAFLLTQHIFADPAFSKHCPENYLLTLKNGFLLTYILYYMFLLGSSDILTCRPLHMHACLCVHVHVHDCWHVLHMCTGNDPNEFVMARQ